MTDEELKECRQFKQARIRYNMSQKEWAERTGISYGLIKKIEENTAKCSEKTKFKVQKFLESHPPRIMGVGKPGRHGLQVNVLYAVFISSMNKIPENNAYSLAAQCAHAMQALLSCSSACSSSGAQEAYFKFIEQFLYASKKMSDGLIEDINAGENVNIEKLLKSLEYKKLRSGLHSEGSKSTGIDGQINLFDN